MIALLFANTTKHPGGINCSAFLSLRGRQVNVELLQILHAIPVSSANRYGYTIYLDSIGCVRLNFF